MVVTAEPQQLVEMMWELTTKFDQALKENGFAQNTAKGQSIAQTFGKGAQKVFQEMTKSRS